MEGTYEKTQAITNIRLAGVHIRGKPGKHISRVELSGRFLNKDKDRSPSANQLFLGKNATAATQVIYNQ